MSEMAQYDPTLMDMAGDIIFKNISAPGMDQVAERKRQALLNAGAIPQSQMTDEEIQLMQQQQQQPPAPDPMMIAAQAEASKAQADTEANQVKLAIAQRETDLKAMGLQLQEQQQQLKVMESQVKARMELAEAEAQMRRQLGEELDRLEALRQVNPSIREDELENLRFRIDECAVHISHANLQLQALRLIITT